ncbi:winged helix-turn-helix domain-containing protein [Roseateles sp. NT4]|uniref:winged helix-turn-helix domain-containing protein n=1 Tax=Roseateles sp. NT4 TaxID=3453715 RepID=UPI003EE9FA81
MTPADAPSLSAQPFQVGDWTVDAAGNRLLRDGETRPLRFKAMALLLLLAERAGQTVPREDIVQLIWDGNEYVAPQAINNAVWSIRQALGDDSESPTYLETIPKKGYRLIAPVRLLDTTAPPAPDDRRRWPFVAIMALVLLFAAAVFWLQHRDDATAPTPARWTITPLTQYAGHEFLGALSPDGRQLAFGWWQGQGGADLYLRATADLHAAPQAIGGAVGDVVGLSWAPDGNAIVYAARRTPEQCQLWIYDLRQNQKRLLAPCHPLFTPLVAWSPRGDRIAFTGDGGGQAGLFLIAPNGGPAQRLTRNPPQALPDHQPAWSPDGARLAFARSDATGGTRDLFELDIASGKLTQLSHEKLHYLHGITYAADGQDLIYATTQHDARMLMRWDRRQARAVPLGLEGSAPALARDGQLVYALMRGHVSIGEVGLDGSNAAPRRLIGSVASDRQPDFNATQRLLAFSSRRSGLPQIWTARLDGGQAQGLTSLPGRATAPAWSADGRRLAFLGHCGEQQRSGLCLLDSPGGTPRALAADGFLYGPPTWDGTQIWVSSNRGGAWQVWRFAADGSNAQALAGAPAPAEASRVASDGRRVYYQPAAASHLLALTPASGAVERLDVAAEGAGLVDWALHPDGLLALTRSDAERFELTPWRSGERRVLARQPLGSFPEMAAFSLGEGGRSVFVELADLAYADLMLAR